MTSWCVKVRLFVVEAEEQSDVIILRNYNAAQITEIFSWKLNCNRKDIKDALIVLSTERRERIWAARTLFRMKKV